MSGRAARKRDKARRQLGARIAAHRAAAAAGPLHLRVGSLAGHVGIDFGRPVARFSLPAAAARQLANALLEHADKADAGAST